MGLSDRMAEALQESYQGLEKKISDRTRDLSALYATLAPLASTDSAQLLQQIVERLKEATGADAALIRILDKETKSLPSPANVGFSSSYLLSTQDLDEGSAVRAAFASGAPIIAADISKDPRLKGKKQVEAGFRSCAFLPLKVSGELRGIVHLASRMEGHFSLDKADHLMAIARQMGVAMENRELLEESKQRAENQAGLVKSLSLLVGASQKLVAQVDIETLAQDILKTVVTSFGIRLAWIGSAEPDGRVRPLYWAGDVAEYLRHVEIRWDDSPLGQGPAGRAIRTGQPVVMDVATDPGFEPWRAPALAHGYREVAAFPLIRGDKPFGHLILYSGEKDFFTSERVELLQTYANIATGALESARLFEETKQQAQEKAALSTIATAVSQSLEVRQILNIAMDKVLEVTGRERGYIRLKDPITGKITLVTHKGISQEYADVLIHHRTTGGKTDQVFATGKSLIVNDTKETPLKGATRREGQNVMAWIPVNARGKVVGILNVASTRLVPFSPRVVELLEAIGNVIGMALENAWLYQESRQQQEIQKLLKELSQDTTSLQIDALFQKVTDKVREFFKVDISDIRLIEDGGMRRLVGSSGIEAERIYREGSNRGRTGWIITNRRPLAITDISEQTDIPSGETVKSLGLRGYLGVPLFSRSGEVTGVLRALSYEPREFTQSEIDLVQQIANGTAVVLTNVELFEQTKRQAQEKAALNSIAMSVGKSLEEQEILNVAIDKVLEVTGRERGYIRLKDPMTGEMRLAVHRGISPEYIEKLLSRRTPGGKNDQVFATGEPLIINDTENVVLSDETRREGHRVMASIPLAARGKVIGVLNISSRQPVPFSTAEVELLQAIANVIGVALENAWLYQESRQQQEIQKLLKELSQDVSTLGLEQLLTKVADNVRQMFQVDIADFRIIEAGAAKFIGRSGELSKKLISSGKMRGRMKWILEHRAPLIIPDITVETGLATGESVRRLGIRGFLALPLFSRGGAIIGVLRALTYRPRDFKQEQVDLLQQLADGVAIAIENARLLEEIQSRAREQAALNVIASAVGQSMELESLCQRALAAVAQVTGREAGYIRLLNKAQGTLRLVAHLGLSDTYIDQFRTERAPYKKAAEVIATRTPLVLSDMSDTEIRPVTRLEGLYAMAFVPLLANGEAVGLLNLGTREHLPFEPRELEFLGAIGNVVGMALENARLFAETEERAQEQAALSAIATTTSQSLHIDEVLQITLDKVLEVTGHERGYIRLKDPLSQDIKLVAHRGISDEYADILVKRRTAGGKTDQVFQTGEALIINDSEDAILKEETRKEGSRSIAWIPMKAQGKVVGVLNVSTGRPMPFSIREVDLLLAIGNVIGMAVENARLFEESQRQEGIQKLLKELSQDITALDIDSFFHKVTDKVREYFKVDISDIRLIEQGGILPPVGLSGLDSKPLYQLGGLRGRAGWIVKNRRAVVIPDTTKDTTIPAGDTTREIGVRGYLAVPLFARSGEVIGILRALTFKPREFSQSEVDLVQQLANGTAIALVNARLFEETERRAREQAALYAVTAAVSGSFDIEQILLKGLDAVLEVAGMDGGYIQFLDGNPPRLVLRAHRGMSQSFMSKTLQGIRPGGKTQQVIATKQPLVLEDIPPDHAGKFKGENITAAAWVPIVAKDKVIAILAVSTKQKRNFPRDQLPLLFSIANALGAALENARLFQETERNLERIRALREIDQAISSTLDLRNVLDILLEKIDLSLPYATATIRLFNKENGLLEPVACRNLDEEEWKSSQWAGGRGIANVAFETKAPLIIRNALDDPRVLDAEFYRKHNLCSYVGVPLIVKDETIGVLGFYTKEEHDFTGEEVEFLSTLAGQAAIAIHNSQLYENARLREKQLEETNRMLSALHAVAATASQSLELERVLQSAIGKITEVFGFDATHIHIYDERTDELLLKAGFARDPNRFVPVQSFQKGQGIVGQVAETGEPLIFEDVQTDPRYRQLSRSKISDECGYRLFAVFPIKGKLRTAGTLACTGIDPRKLTSGEIQILEAMADQIAVAIENGELYERLKQKIEELQEANKVKDEFLSVMSHELRTPLNVVMGYAAMIKDEMLGGVNTEQKRALEKVISRSNDLLNMITSILYATSIEAKEVRVQNSEFGLGDLLDELKRIYEISLVKPIKLDWDYDPGLPQVFLDRDKVRVVLQKLIDNATKFTETGGVTVSARLSESRKQNPENSRRAVPLPDPANGWLFLEPPWLEVKVTDTGVGIAGEKLPIIFDRFRQADSSETRRYGGVGLGLYIAKHFAELLGGKIDVETEEGKGSIFTVRIPCPIVSSMAANPGKEKDAIDGHVSQIH